MAPPRTTLARWRWHRGLTQRDLASLTGVSVKTIEKIEAGTSKGSPKTALLLAGALAVPVEEVVGALIRDYKGDDRSIDGSGADGERDGEITNVTTAAEA